MIMCRACQHQEIEGALFCGECGAQMQVLTTLDIHTDGINIRDFNEPPPKRSRKSASETMSLQILEGGQLLFPLMDKNELTIGRVSDGQAIMPDIDLTPYEAYEYGVSRLHAVLKKNKDIVTIKDLGSSNGTYVDRARLKPEQEYPLSHGNIISLGKLKIQFLLRN